MKRQFSILLFTLQCIYYFCQNYPFRNKFLLISCASLFLCETSENALNSSRENIKPVHFMFIACVSFIIFIMLVYRLFICMLYSDLYRILTASIKSWRINSVLAVGNIIFLTIFSSGLTRITI